MRDLLRGSKPGGDGIVLRTDVLAPLKANVIEAGDPLCRNALGGLLFEHVTVGLSLVFDPGSQFGCFRKTLWDIAVSKVLLEFLE